MKKSNVSISRGSDAVDGEQYVLINVDGVQVPLDPDRAEKLAMALSSAAVDVRAIRTSKTEVSN